MINKTITFDRFIRWLLVGLLIFAILYAINYLSSVLLPFFIACFLAYLLYPVVIFFQYRLHVPGRLLSILGIAGDGADTHAPMAGDIPQGIFLCGFASFILCFTLCAIGFVLCR